MTQLITHGWDKVSNIKIQLIGEKNISSVQFSKSLRNRLSIIQSIVLNRNNQFNKSLNPSKN